jgi:hypothetical protein
VPYGIVMPLLRAAFLSDAEHRDLLTQAGFTEVATMDLAGKKLDLRHGAKAAAIEDLCRVGERRYCEPQLSR